MPETFNAERVPILDTEEINVKTEIVTNMHKFA